MREKAFIQLNSCHCLLHIKTFQSSFERMRLAAVGCQSVAVGDGDVVSVVRSLFFSSLLDAVSCLSSTVSEDCEDSFVKWQEQIAKEALRVVVNGMAHPH